MDANSIKVLIVEDNPGDVRLVEEMLRQPDASIEFDLPHVNSLSKAVENLSTENFDVVLLDLSLPDGSGLDTVLQTHSASPAVPIVVLSSLNDEDLAIEAVHMGAQDYLVKGSINTSILIRSLRYAIERKRSELAMKHRIEFEKLITSISTDFINITTEGIHKEIQRALMRIGQFAGVDRAFVFKLSEDGSQLNNIFEWSSDGIEPKSRRMQGLATTSLPWFTKRLMQFQNIHVPVVDELPPEAREEKNLLQSQETRSLVVVPMSFRGFLVGFLGFDAVRKQTSWTEEDMTLLRMAGEVFVNALERERAEGQTKQAYAELDQIFNSAAVCMCVISRDKNVLRVNNTFIETTGLESDDIIGKKCFDMIPCPACHSEKCPVTRIMDGEKHIEYETEFKQKNGTAIQSIFSATPFKNAVGEIIGAVISFKDITELKRVENKLAAERERLAVTLRSIADGVITTDIKGKVVMINAVAENLTGWPQQDAGGKPSHEILNMISMTNDQIVDDPVQKILTERKMARLANKAILVAKDGNKRLINYIGAPIRDDNGDTIGAVLVFRDITDTQKLQEELQKAQKLESIGLLAGGIAHDFNNILTAIMGNISYARMIVGEDEKLAKILADTESASVRARDLTQQLLTFSRGGKPVKKATHLPELIKEVSNFALGGSNVQCRFFAGEGLWPVEIDRGQISQVITNLIVNSRHAMPEGGMILSYAENVSTTPEDNLPLGPGSYVKITLKDHGTGIAKESIPNIFDPYFTTKKKGSGLGLSIAYSIIKKHRGLIQVESELDEGTTFYVYLPATETRPVEDETGARPESPAPEIIQGMRSGNILIMDDEEIVRNAAGRILEYLGYQAKYAADGAEALEMYRQTKGSVEQFDAIIMDLTVPGGIGGKEAIKQLLEIDPEAKAIVSSGYSNDPIMSQYQDYGFKAVATKPYSMEELFAVLNQVLT
jgi:PAS domain S-box-containing protein